LQVLRWGTRPQIGEKVEGRVWHPVKANRNGHNLSIETNTRSRFIQEQDTLPVLGLGTRPKLGERAELGGRVWYLVKALHGGHNMSIETETL
jgi:hypothetical protein